MLKRRKSKGLISLSSILAIAIVAGIMSIALILVNANLKVGQRVAKRSELNREAYYISTYIKKELGSIDRIKYKSGKYMLIKDDENISYIYVDNGLYRFSNGKKNLLSGLVKSFDMYFDKASLLIKIKIELCLDDVCESFEVLAFMECEFDEI